MGRHRGSSVDRAMTPSRFPRWILLLTMGACAAPDGRSGSDATRGADHGDPPCRAEQAGDFFLDADSYEVTVGQFDVGQGRIDGTLAFPVGNLCICLRRGDWCTARSCGWAPGFHFDETFDGYKSIEPGSYLVDVYQGSEHWHPSSGIEGSWRMTHNTEYSP